MLKVKRALISVSDKTGIVDFARGLLKFNVEIISTGGTAKMLKNVNVAVTEISDYTGFPEMLDGRVKTLHPAVHGGLLAVRDNPRHMEEMAAQKLSLIDLLVVNLYPFEKVTQKANVSLEEAIENIDIGGPAMLRSASKNFKHVAVVCSPAHYAKILQELDTNRGILPDRLLANLAVEAFGHTSRYDSLIHHFLSQRFQSGDVSPLPKDLDLHLTKAMDLRYGENPHQAAAFYREEPLSGLAAIKQLHGKELSFNNLLDLNSALDIVKDLDGPGATVIKHNNPTGVAEAKDLCRAYRLAWQADKLSAFGGIVGVNRKLDKKTAQAIFDSGFMECVIAPGYEPEALKILKQKKDLRLIQLELSDLPSKKSWDLKKVSGGLLLQQKDERTVTVQDLKVVTKKKPTRAQIESLLFAWKVVKHVKSNAIVLVKGKRTVGIGAGQTSRVGSVAIAIEKAGKLARGSFLASDAFIPKVDNIQLAAKAGVKAVIHTGGSIADAEVIKEADRKKLILVATGVRHFKH